MSPVPHDPQPLLSVVLATDVYETIRPVIAALRRQRAPHTIEPVIALPQPAVSSVRRDELEVFGATQIVTVESPIALPEARAAAIRAATAPVVFIGETHTYAQPGWAESLLSAFGDAFAAVVPAIDNANPKTALSCAAYIIDYGPWGSFRPAGEMHDPLLYNTAYRRSVLLSLGADLERVLDPSEESMRHFLRAGGHRATFAPDARILHVNTARLGSFFVEKFCSGVMLGTHRAARWPWRRRLLYILGSPLIPAVILARVASGAIGAGLTRVPAATIPALAVGAVTKAAGELVGYLGVKMPTAAARLQDIELHKVRYAGRAP